MSPLVSGKFLPDSGCFKNRYFSTLLPVDPYLIIYEKLSQFTIYLLYSVCLSSLDLNKNCFERSYSKYMSYNKNRYNLWQPFFKMAANKMVTVSNAYTCRPIIILISENQI